jgi:hypothetical protein
MVESPLVDIWGGVGVLADGPRLPADVAAVDTNGN